MEDTTNLEDWEFLSDSDTNSFNVEDVIHSDYFALDSTIPSARSQITVHSESQPGLHGSGKGGSFPEDDSKFQVDSHGIEPRGVRQLVAVEIAKRDSFHVEETTFHQNSSLIVSKDELGIEESNKIDVLLEEIAKQDSFYPDCAQVDVDDSKDELHVEESNKGDTFDKEIEPIHQNSDEASGLREPSSVDEDEKSRELSSELSADACNSESVSSVDGERKVVAWWKVPIEIIKMCAFRARTVWSIPIAAAVIGILMAGRRLYKMKHKSRTIPFKVSFEDKKATSRILLRAARLNEIVVRRVPVVRSTHLSAAGLTPWPVVGIF